jgi:hypothetical protein
MWSKMLNRSNQTYMLRNAFIFKITNAHLSKCKLVTFLPLYLLWFVLASITKKGEIEREIVSTFPIIDFGV